ncbi:hypothetical protein [Streptomyces sp. NPDC057554]|uniref:hypothetical protein n=1 Tax=Streptomyces sp. NPDC057554 TaxID=3350538 RepID=UPI00369DED47
MRTKARDLLYQAHALVHAGPGPGLRRGPAADTVLRRLAHRGTRHRFETDPASTQREIDLYQEAPPHPEALGYRILAVDATGLTPSEVAATIADALPSRPATVIDPTAPARSEST